MYIESNTGVTRAFLIAISTVPDKPKSRLGASTRSLLIVIRPGRDKDYRDPRIAIWLRDHDFMSSAYPGQACRNQKKKNKKIKQFCKNKFKKLDIYL